MFIGRPDVEAETPILWHDVKSSFEKTLMLGKIDSKRRRGQQRMKWLDDTDSMDMCLSKLWEFVQDREAWHAPVHAGRKKSDATEQLN